MTRLVQTELLKLWTTRTARVLLALATAGTAALVTLVLVLARPARPRPLAARRRGGRVHRTGDGTLAMWAGGLVLAAYGLALAMAGGRLVVRRDLS